MKKAIIRFIFLCLLMVIASCTVNKDEIDAAIKACEPYGGLSYIRPETWGIRAFCIDKNVSINLVKQ